MRTYASVDGGMSDLLRPMLYGAVYEPILANRADAEPTQTLRLVGKHCESGDVLVAEASCRRSPPATWCACRRRAPTVWRWPPTTTGSPARRCVFVDGGRARLVTRRETYADLAGAGRVTGDGRRAGPGARSACWAAAPWARRWCGP